MATGYNPFGGWGNSEAPPPSIFGALPYPQSSAPSPTLADRAIFVFTDYNPSILNCTIVDNRARTVFYISTETTPRYTFVKDRDGRNLGVIEWQTHPSVEIRGIVPKQEVRSWLALSPDARSRVMTVQNARYAWAPSGSHILLYTTTSSVPQVLGKVSKTASTVTLELSAAALELGLLECAIVATLLMQSGRNID
ncbi:hypothetical protein GLOTRDRAFT_133842 [Gloeophyllum trabeum ATCC 11539]|uniref:DUF6593 domain-containing protein n=1 Tax=Gloeophyllum trabeum (strain ATCC 11539 / FP-39264 / Madison 617) TaxID=670483 RepID=S7PSV4_GLOTA|nr:uncharacterized protein GLOTRDRAFT_133842 [Gloeophyllum trabeum ATCC 11539]EPQ50462.1 hypothetical protein GLOTRDRAFT_133842 [Gloeophyllum trabeum ATCC 11539]